MPESNRQDLLPVLKQIQKEKTALPALDLEELALQFNWQNNEVFGVASFYSFLSLKPQGKYVIRICKSLPCYMQNAPEIVNSVRQILGIGPGEVTRDGKFSFELADCIGACDQAPVMMINDEIHGHLTPERIERILKEYS
jgi:NADH-quinone oxidoreductase subunit E